MSRRLAGSDAEVGRRVSERDRRAGDPTLSASAGSARRVPPTTSGAPPGGATVLPPVRHVDNPSSYYGSYHGSGGSSPYYCYPTNCYYPYAYPCYSSYPWYGFSIGFSFGVSWCSPWYSWSCGYGYPYYGYPTYGYAYYGSPTYWGWYGYPCYTVRYSSPYYYRYRYPYYCYAPLYWYDNCYYGFTYEYGFVPYYQQSYIEYRRIEESQSEVAPVPRTERDLSAAELRFCEGWTLLRSGDEANAAQVLYTSTIDLGDSALVHWFLAVALAGTDDIDLAHRTLGEVLRLDPDFLRHRWNPIAHLGADGDRELREGLAAARTSDPLAAAPLALEASLALLADDALRLEALRGVIAESLIVDPEAPGLAEALAEIRRRGETAGGAPSPHPDAIAEAWLASPSCEAIPSLGLAAAGSSLPK